MPVKNLYWFDEILKDDDHHIGEKGIKLAEFKKIGVSIPEGFVVSSVAFDNFLKENKLQTKANHLISTVNFNDPNSLKQVSNLINKYFQQGHLSSELKHELYSAYKEISGNLEDVHVKVFPSARGYSKYFKNEPNHEVKGEASLLHAIKQYWASNFSEINLLKSNDNNYQIKALVIQKSIDPQKSGKVYTIDPETYDKSKIVIKAKLGHFDDDNVNLVSLPDYYVIDKKDHKVIEKGETIQSRATKRINGNKKTISLKSSHSKKKKLTDNEIEKLIIEAKLVEKFSYFPQEIDWIAEGENIYLIHAKPITHNN